MGFSPGDELRSPFSEQVCEHVDGPCFAGWIRHFDKIFIFLQSRGIAYHLMPRHG